MKRSATRISLRPMIQIANAPAGLAIAVELDYETTHPDIVDALDAARTPAGTRFVDLARARPEVPVVMARLDTTLP